MLQVSFVPSVYETALCCIEGQGMSGASHYVVGDHLGPSTAAGKRAFLPNSAAASPLPVTPHA